MLSSTQINQLTQALYTAYDNTLQNLIFITFPGIDGPGEDEFDKSFRALCLPLYCLSYPPPSGYHQGYEANNYEVSNWDILLVNCTETLDLMRSKLRVEGVPSYFEQIFIRQYINEADKYKNILTYELRNASIVYTQEDRLRIALYLNIYCEEYKISALGDNGWIEALYKPISHHVEYPDYIAD